MCILVKELFLFYSSSSSSSLCFYRTERNKDEEVSVVSRYECVCALCERAHEKRFQVHDRQHRYRSNVRRSMFRYSTMAM